MCSHCYSIRTYGLGLHCRSVFWAVCIKTVDLYAQILVFWCGIAVRPIMLSSTLLLHDRHPHHLKEKVVLQHILKNVSRSFYLSLRVLPGSVRQQVSLAYLFCRVADTIADTTIFPRCQRLQILRAFRQQFLLVTPSFDDLKKLQAALRPQRTQQEAHQLFCHLPTCFHLFVRLSEVDRQLVRELVLTLTY